MAASTVLVLALAVLLLPASSSAARAPPGSSPLVATCKEGPFQAHCVKELGPRLLDIQTALASVSPRGALIAGVPGTVDFSSLVAVAMEAATEAGAVATTIFDGKLPGFNASVPDFKKSLDNCTVTMKSAMKKLHGATAAMKVHAHQVATMLANKAIVDVGSCTMSCHNLTGDMRLILEASLVEFQKMLRIAVTFISKLAAKTPPGPPPMRGIPPARRP
jgi:pectinesterase inhibitor-like protein